MAIFVFVSSATILKTDDGVVRVCGIGEMFFEMGAHVTKAICLFVVSPLLNMRG